MKYLIPLLFPLTLYADVTGNLITNGTFDNGSTGWTSSGDAQVIGDCCPGGHDFEFGDMGSIEQDFNLYSDTITQPMLNNGITLNSSTEWQNGEGGEGSWAPNRGGADTFTVRLQIKDAFGNVLATTTQIRQDVTGINGVDFTDTLTYTGVGSNIGNIYLSGEDANAPANLGGPNVDNISVTMTYDPTVLTLEQTQEIAQIFEEIEENIELSYEFIPEEIETFFIEEIPFEEVITELPEIIEVFEEEEFIEETIVLAPTLLEEEIIESNIETLETPEVESNIVETFVTEEIIEEQAEIVEEVFEEIIEVAEITTEESINEEEITTENIGGSEGENETETTESQEETSTETIEEREETPTENNSGSTQVAISVDDIAIKVADKIKTIDGQLKATQMIVAKVMQNNNKISSYSNVNKDIFIQPELKSIDIGTYTNSTYVDIRNIYPNQTYEDRLWTSRQ